MDEFCCTSKRRIVRASSETNQFSSLKYVSGEDHELRTEILEEISDFSPLSPGATLIEFVHLTDTQLADLASPSRLEFLEKYQSNPKWAKMLPAYRPQEFLLPIAIEIMLGSIHRLNPEIIITTGDHTDNAQLNELTLFLTLLDGGHIEPGSDNNNLQDSPTCSNKPEYWNPEKTDQPDNWKTKLNFPDYPGAIEGAVKSWRTSGLGIKWLACFGNHDQLLQGRVVAPKDYDKFLISNQKPVDTTVETHDAFSDYLLNPFVFSEGSKIKIDSIESRKMLSKQEYIKNHFSTKGTPKGHGFNYDSMKTGIGYFSYNHSDSIKFIVLDTTNPEGGVDGCLDETQFNWLIDQLESTKPGSENQKLVILASHHGLSTMTNNYGNNKKYLSDEIRDLIFKYPQVISWFSGHTHINKITPQTDGTPYGCFWEISTSSIAEWPVQVRKVGIELHPKSIVILKTTMVDSIAPEMPDGSTDFMNLASLHRLIASNSPGSVGGFEAQGTTKDRNVILPIKIPRDLANKIISSI